MCRYPLIIETMMTNELAVPFLEIFVWEFQRDKWWASTLCIFKNLFYPFFCIFWFMKLLFLLFHFNIDYFLWYLPFLHFWQIYCIGKNFSISLLIFFCKFRFISSILNFYFLYVPTSNSFINFFSIYIILWFRWLFFNKNFGLNFMS